MPAPTNTSALTAIDLGSLPATVNQRVDDAGTTFTVWYKFTAPAGFVVTGAWGFGDLITYTPTIKPYVGPASAPVQILSISGVNVPIQFPVTALQEYFLEIIPNGGNPSPANLTLSVLSAPNDSYVRGDVLIPPDTAGFPACIYNPEFDFTVRQFIKNFPVASDAGSAGCILENGGMLINNDDDKTVIFVDRSFALVTTDTYAASGSASDIAIRSNRTLNKIFYTKNQGGVAAAIKAFDDEGTILGTTYTLTAITDVLGFCVNNDETIIYHVSGIAGTAVHRWDIPGAVALSDLAAGIANHISIDVLVIPTGDILVSFHNLAGDTAVVRRYNAAGVQQAEYNFDDISEDNAIRMAYAIESELSTHFWVWGHYNDGPDQVSKFVKVKISDGTREVEFDAIRFNGGAYAYSQTATPFARFGNQGSCPFIILAVTNQPGLFKIVTDKRTDTINDTGDVENDTVAIPNPTFKTALMP